MKWGVMALVIAALGAALYWATERGPFASCRASNESGPHVSLKTIASAQADFRGNDRDGDRVQNYWRADIAGLYSLKPSGSEESIKLIERFVAGADAKPTMPVEGFAEPTPKRGYWNRSLRFKGETRPDPNRFAAVSYPASKDAGVYMFVISHENTIFRKPFEGIIPETYPDDPLKEGWAKLD